MGDIRDKRRMIRERLGNAVALLALIVIGLMALIGPSGLLAWGDDAAKLEAYEKRIADLEEERAEIANRVELLDPDHVDPDLADELVRKNLNVLHQDEYVVELESEQ